MLTRTYRFTKGRTMTTLEGKVAIITGARRGIGRAEALTLAGAGAKVVVCDIVFDDEMTSLQDEIAAAGGESLAFACDVTKKDDIDHVVAQTIATYGRVDILVNNAQTGLTPVPWEELSDKLFTQSFESGPLASFRFMQACFPYMKAQGWGRIINTSSGASRGGVPNFGHYAAAKGAIASLTYAAATDWGQYGITANVIYPAILTPALKGYLEAEPSRRAEMEARVPVRYVGDPLDDLGPIVLFLASDASGYLTGHPFFVDGGAGQGPR
ncbi:SDR family NAD(P)-dependent oxidoreductase [Microbacterium sp. X-17]|uniref:SDR family NAD(P)-dependent oxidoreductase n=1 Tax=Microbacterium sp. X-17 TaxID=3144404 RepID=UPI0031F55834